MKDNCPFCNIEPDREIIAENWDFFSVFDLYPVNMGHALIISKRHCKNYFDLTKQEQENCWSMVIEIKKVITQKFNPDGFNIGININEAAGQTIDHAHIHLIPRYKGDMENPEGGVRGVIPEKRMYKGKN